MSRRWDQTPSSGAQWQNKAQWTQTETLKFHLNMRRSFFTLSVTEHWNRLPREAVESLCLEIFKTQLYVILQLGLGEPALAEGLGYMISRGPFQHYSVIL